MVNGTSQHIVNKWKSFQRCPQRYSISFIISMDTLRSPFTTRVFPPARVPNSRRTSTSRRKFACKLLSSASCVARRSALSFLLPISECRNASSIHIRVRERIPPDFLQQGPLGKVGWTAAPESLIGSYAPSVSSVSYESPHPNPALHSSFSFSRKLVMLFRIHRELPKHL